MNPDDAAPWMPLNVGDWLADTGHLDGPEQGAYFLLVLHYWRTREPLKDDNARLARIARTPPEAWEAMRPTIAELFVVSGGTWRHKRIDKELAESRKRRSKAQDAAAGRWRKPSSTPSNAQAPIEQCSNDARASSEHSQIQIQVQKQKQHKKQNKQGKKPESAKSADSAAVQPRSNDNGHAKNAQQERVEVVFDVFRRYGEQPPPGPRVAHWLAKYDQARLLRELVDMGQIGLLVETPNYLEQVLAKRFKHDEGMAGSADQLRAAALAAIDRFQHAGGGTYEADSWRYAAGLAHGPPDLKRILTKVLAAADDQEKAQRENDDGRQDANTPRD